MSVHGTVGLMDFDRGCFTALGGVIETYVVDGDERQAYAVEVPGSAGIERLDGKVPLYFKAPEDREQETILPAFTFARTSLEPAFQRRPFYNLTARVPASYAVQSEVVLGISEGVESKASGYDKYSHEWQDTPWDISYDLQIRARTQMEYIAMLTHAMRHFKPLFFSFGVMDSKNCLRQYDAGEISITDTSDLSEVQRREASATLSFVVQGEISLVPSWDEGAAQELPQFTYETL